MSNLHQLLTASNVFIFKLTHGHLGSKMGRQSVLLLHTVGRKSGKERSTILSYYRDGEHYLVIGSNWGSESHPGWYHNLLQQPRTTIQVGNRAIQVEARTAEADEYLRLWQLVARSNGQYIEYQKALKRRIPIVILTPINLH
jgi:deazaflavin-dependent oxidoreductase (nitroreductase family)